MTAPATKSPRLLAVSTEMLFRQCEQWGVPVIQGAVAPLNGIYMAHPDHPGRGLITLSTSLVEGTPLFRVVLATLMGHHACLLDAWSPLPARDLMAASLLEKRAARWAADFLIPSEALALTAGASINELAETLDVTVDLVLLASKHLNRGG